MISELDGKAVLYTLPTCGRCKVIKEKLKKAEIPFLEISDYELLVYDGITSVPVLRTFDGKRMSNMTEMVRWIEQYAGEDNIAD